MCGIGGILRVHPRGEVPPPGVAIPEAWLDVIDEAIKHRGPDGKGRLRDRVVREDGSVVDVALVHRRLSIIDHRDGWQPMVQGGTALLSREGAPYRATPTHVCARCAERTRNVNAGPRQPAGHSEAPRASNPSDLSADLGSPVLTIGVRQNLAVVFNGCIYNHCDLRKELEAAGHVFATDHSDTEVLLHGWAEWARDLTAHLDGMFSLALWDRSRATLALARDPFGEKPLFHDREPGPTPEPFVVFASTAAAVRAVHRLLAPESNTEPTDVRAWTKFGWNQLATPLSSVREVSFGTPSETFPERPAAPESPGIDWSGHGWWHDVLAPRNDTLTVDQADAALTRAVGSRLEADVPVGCFLSGGIDSALVAHYAQQVRPDITAFTVRMPVPDFDESTAAAETARVLGVRHEILDCDPRPAEDLVAAVTQLGLPFGDSSLLPSTWVSRAARKRVRVALSGDGGDEMFLGYERYRAIRHIQRLMDLPPEALQRVASWVRPGASPRSHRTRASRLLSAAAGDGFKELVAIFPHPMDVELGLGSGFIGHWGLTRIDGLDEATKLARRFDLMFYLPSDLMRKSDTASMSVALEVRSPFLARTIAGLAINASLDSLMPRGQRKGLLRAVARKYFPSEIVDRPKQGFAIPIGEWFRSDYGGMKQLLLDHLESAEPWGSPSLGIDLNMKFVRRMLDEHMGEKRDHSQRLYMLLVLSIWAKGLGK